MITGNTLFTGDNLYIMHGMNSESVDLIYLDPPFNSKRMYKSPVGSKAAGTSFKDMWTWEDVDLAYLEGIVDDYPYLVQFIQSIEVIHGKPMMSYITYMTQRLIEMHRILKNTGSLYLHCDPTASHYLKIVLDRVSGEKNFKNEIVWCYTGPSASKKNFPRKHDIILRYSKGDKWTFNFNSIRVPYSESTKQRRSHRESGESTGGGIKFMGMSENAIEKGRLIGDWWSDIPSGGQISKKELTGYPTQKPRKLLERIIEASTEGGGGNCV